MKRILNVGISAVFLVMTSAVHAGAAEPVGESKVGNFTNNQQVHEDYVGAQILLRHGCSQKLHITFTPSNNYSAEEKSALVACVRAETVAIASQMSAKLKSGDLKQGGQGEFALVHSLAFARQYSAKAREQDPNELLRKVREEGRRSTPFKPE